jgi:hypothetical protein
MKAAALQALGDFAPVFRTPGFKGGAVQGGDESEPGVISMPFVAYDSTVEAFVNVAYAHEWVLKGFDWSTWAGSSEALSLRDDEGAIENATAEQLARLLTVCIRQDRFVEGALLEAFESGLILRIVNRALALAQLAGSPP